MGVVVLVVLAAIWAAVLLPPILRSRIDSRPAGSIYDFRRQLRVLGRTAPIGAVVSPYTGVVVGPVRSAARAGSRRSSAKRRRDVFAGLLVAMAGSLVLGIIPALRVLWVVHVIVDVLFVAYIGALVYIRNIAAEREAKVRFLPSARQPEPALLLRRSAN